MGRIRFWKLHGAGNDFALFTPDRRPLGNPPPAAWIRKLCARKTGIGSDGIILLDGTDAPDRWRMRFFNPDGAEADLCGNGARCAAKLLHDLGLSQSPMTLDTPAGPVRATMAGDEVALDLPDATELDARLGLDIEPGIAVSARVCVGVPHTVVLIETAARLCAIEVDRVGRAIREHAVFAPRGANVNFVAVGNGNALRLRTYERGVEQETLACGTGAVASAIVAAHLKLVRLPCRVTVAGGDVLGIDGSLTSGGACAVRLQGPAVHVFEGTVDAP